MSIFIWLFPAKKDTHAAVCMKGKGRFQTEVTDCELFQQGFERLCAGYDFDGEPLTAQATLVELPYDPRNRHPVQVEAKGQIIGHLRDRDAKRFLHQLHRDQNSGMATCPLRVHFHPMVGSGGAIYTARIDLPE